MTGLRDVFAPEVLAALDELVQERIADALAELPKGKPWLTIEEAGEYARLSPRTIARRIANGDLHATGIGRRRIVRRADLDALLEGRK